MCANKWGMQLKPYEYRPFLIAGPARSDDEIYHVAHTSLPKPQGADHFKASKVY